MISIVTVNYKTPDWIKLQWESIKKNTKVPYEYIVVDNASEEALNFLSPEDQVIELEKNIGHGAALDLAVMRYASHDYVLVLDSDAHLLREGWEDDLFKFYNSREDIKLIGAEGDLLKPIRVATMFFEKDYFIKRSHSFQEVDTLNNRGGHMKMDIGVHFSMKVQHDLGKAMLLPIGDNLYKDVWGETYYLNDQPFVYHNWYGSRFENAKIVDGLKREDFLAAKERLFEQACIVK